MILFKAHLGERRETFESFITVNYDEICVKKIYLKIYMEIQVNKALLH